MMPLQFMCNGHCQMAWLDGHYFKDRCETDPEQDRAKTWFTCGMTTELRLSESVL